jgi:RNA polymerase sigma factor (sigma-70 family)
MDEMKTTSALIEKAAKGDRHAWDRLVTDHYKRVRSFVATKYPTFQDADLDDATQETFLAAWEGLHSFPPAADFVRWLCGIAWNKATDVYRRSAQARTMSDPIVSEQEPAQGPDFAETDQALASYLNNGQDHRRERTVAKHLILMVYKQHDVPPRRLKTMAYDAAAREIIAQEGVLDPSPGYIKSERERVQDAWVRFEKVMGRREFLAETLLGALGFKLDLGESRGAFERMSQLGWLSGNARWRAEELCHAICETNDAFKPGRGADSEALRRFDKLWREAEVGFAWAAARWQDNDDLARLVVQYANSSVYVRDLRQDPHDKLIWQEVAKKAAQKIHDYRGYAIAIRRLGQVYSELGQWQKSVECCNEALTIGGEIGDRQGVANALNRLGLAAAAQGRLDEAIDYFTRTLPIARDIGHDLLVGEVQDNLGCAYTAKGQAEKAIESYYGPCLDLLEGIRAFRSRGTALSNLGLAYAAMKKVDRAIDLYDQSLALHRNIGYREGEALTCWHKGNALANLGSPAQAIRLMEVRVRYEKGLRHALAFKHAEHVQSLRQRLAGKR